MTKISDKSTDSADTLFAQAGGFLDPHTGGVVPPLQPATTFARADDYSLVSEGHLYARDHNDLVRLAEKILCEAEGAEEGLLFGSGMAAIAALIRSVPNGGRIVLQSGIYWGTTKFIREFCERRGIDLLELDCSDMRALEEATQSIQADLLWIETPSNPYLKTVDIAACAKIADRIGAKLAVDSTAATPILTQPIKHGAHFVMHSATKAINGHSDVLAGFICAKSSDEPVWNFIKSERAGGGAVLGPFEAWLLIRGMRTLPLRIERMSDSALKIANAMTGHPKVHTVLYPGLVDDPGHSTAQRQMDTGFGSLLSIQVEGGSERALKVAGKLNLFKRATSLGGVESLVEHRHSIEDTVPDDLLRLSVGIESADDLIADLEQALG